MIKIYYIIFIYLLFILLNNKCKFINKLEPYKNTNKIKNIFFITLYRDKIRVKNIKNIINKYNIKSVSQIVKAIDGSKIYNNSI